MDITRFSASGLKTYEDCPASFNAEYVQRARVSGGVAANLGTAAHEALMGWTIHDHMDFDLKLLLDRFEIEAAKLALPEEQCIQGRKMLEQCYRRLEDNPPYMILAVEEKEVIKVKIGGREVELVYIWDRCDQMENGAIEVVDYKSWFANLDPPTARQLMQVKMYAVTALIKYKHLNPPAVWVTLDQLRYGTVGVKFTPDEIRGFYEYIKDVIKRIWADPGTEERVNPNCRYCVRKDSCQTLAKVKEVNPEGVLATGDFDTIAEQMASTYEAKKALELMLEEYEEWLDAYLEEHQIPEATSESGVLVKYNPTSRRKVDSERVATVVGPEISQRYGKFSMEDIDGLLKGDEITEDQKRKIKALIQTNISTRVIARYPKK